MYTQLFQDWRFFIFHIHLKVLYIYSVFLMWKRRFNFYEICNFSYISVYKRPDDGSQLDRKRVAVNKLVKTGVVCDWFDTYAAIF